MKNIIKINSLIFACLLLLYANNSYAQSSKTQISRKNNSSQTKKATYEVNGTKYIRGETYKTTGQPKVERSSTAKKQFLKENGYHKEPNGYQVDHIKPLSQGGSDTPNNMQLLTKEQHKQKTANERKQTSSSNNNSSINYSTKKSSSNSSKSQYYKNSSSKSKNSTNYKSYKTRKK